MTTPGSGGKRTPETTVVGETGKDFSLDSSEGAWTRFHLDFRLLASSTVKEHTSAVTRCLVGGVLLWKA